MTMDILGPNLEEQRKKLGMFAMETAVQVGIEMLSRLTALHSAGFLHRDLKPDNYVNGQDACDRTIYLIDFGLSKSYLKGKAGIHVPFKINSYITGTARYTSINSHYGYEMGRRDDIESWCYLMLYFLKGSLPW
jgi:serine/threonine protein kinase